MKKQMMRGGGATGMKKKMYAGGGATMKKKMMMKGGGATMSLAKLRAEAAKMNMKLVPKTKKS